MFSNQGEGRTEYTGFRPGRYLTQEVGLEEIGTHTLRKTFGYYFYKQYKDVAALQEIFNHSSPAVAVRYIGITQDIIDEKVYGFSL
ncbi:tyrosine-type recombinase/integrase [Cytobacillus solani]|uniref:tyrosine-type recombinase/integrase n=1 Tax=Cytobacillus solani TaxID=1637975 RepID=UPI0009E68670